MLDPGRQVYVGMLAWNDEPGPGVLSRRLAALRFWPSCSAAARYSIGEPRCTRLEVRPRFPPCAKVPRTTTSCQRGERSSTMTQETAQKAPDATSTCGAQARRIPALSSQRLRQPGVAGAVAHLCRPLQDRRAGMARAGDARPIRHDDRQGDRRPQPHAQDQGVARGRIAGAAQAGDAARQPRRLARGIPVADARPAATSTRARADRARFCPPVAGNGRCRPIAPRSIARSTS